MRLSFNKLYKRKEQKIMSKKAEVKKENPAKVESKEVKPKQEAKPAKVIVKPEVKTTIKQESEGEPKMLLSLVVKTMKATVLREGGGTRKLTPEGRKSRATKALTEAMMRRQWVDNLDGTYSLNQVKVDTNTDNFEVKIQDGVKDYALTLGKGAIRELDAYMRLR